MKCSDSCAQYYIERLHIAVTFIRSTINTICEILSREVPRAKISTIRRASYTPANLANLTTHLVDANLRERMFPFLRLTELMVAEAVRAHAIEIVNNLCRRLCGSNARDKGNGYPSLRIQIIGAIDATLEIVPTKTSVLELLHSVIVRCMASLDELPRLVRYILSNAYMIFL